MWLHVTTPVGHRTLTDIQPSLRPEQHTARSELVTRNTTRRRGPGKMIIEQLFFSGLTPPGAAPEIV